MKILKQMPQIGGKYKTFRYILEYVPKINNYR